MGESVNEEETGACGLCGRDTEGTGTKRCDRCWELETRIEQSPKLALQVIFNMGGFRLRDIIKELKRKMNSTRTNRPKAAGWWDELVHGSFYASSLEEAVLCLQEAAKQRAKYREAIETNGYRIEEAEQKRILAGVEFK